MTTTIRSRAPVTRFQASAAFWPVVAVTVGVAVVSAVVSPPAWFSVVVVVTVVAVLGIPHGAVDHLVVEALAGRRDALARRRFVRNYVLAAGGVGLIWLAAPPVALVAFIVVSVHHFGQSDLAYLRLSGPGQRVAQWSRGLLLIGLPLVAHVSTVAPVIERLGGGDPSSWPWLVDRWWVWCAALVAQHAVIGAAVAPRIADRTVVGREAIAVASLTLLFVTADPLIGFAVYFGLWHSLAHLFVLADLLGAEPNPMRSVARLAAPLTAVSLVGLAAVGIGAGLAGRPDLLVPVVFVFVSMLTAPHMVVVERLWASPATD